MDGKEEGVRLVPATETLLILATESSALFTGLHFLECKAIAFDHFLPCNGISHFLIFSLLYTCSLNYTVNPTQNTMNHNRSPR